MAELVAVTEAMAPAAVEAVHLKEEAPGHGFGRHPPGGGKLGRIAHFESVAFSDR